MTALVAALGLVALATPALADGSIGSARLRVLGVHPGVVRGRGGGPIVIVGSGFSPGVAITVGGAHAKVVAVRNARTVIAIAPAGIGTEVVRAVTSGGTSASNGRSVLHFATRVLVVGDSLAIDLGWGFTPQLDAREGISVVDDAVQSSGLVRTDYYDWPAHLRADIAAVHPDVVETLFGTNDEQAITTARSVAEPDTPAWDRAYAARVRQIAAIVREAGATLAWVSLPRMGPQSVLGQPYVSNLVTLDRNALAAARRAAFVDAWLLFTTPAGAYTPYVELAPHVWALGHDSDGTHLTPEGAAVVDVRTVVALQNVLTHR